jgi:mRNA interferase MazF
VPSAGWMRSPVEPTAWLPERYASAVTEDAALAIPDLAVSIMPTSENGCSKACWAVSHLMVTTSKQRLRSTLSCITLDQLAARLLGRHLPVR